MKRCLNCGFVIEFDDTKCPCCGGEMKDIVSPLE
jgi:RNA polymerase subunit RPABC4/transcription elongation factor Spt4